MNSTTSGKFSLYAIKANIMCFKIPYFTKSLQRSNNFMFKCPNNKNYTFV